VRNDHRIMIPGSQVCPLFQDSWNPLNSGNTVRETSGIFEESESFIIDRGCKDPREFEDVAFHNCLRWFGLGVSTAEHLRGYEAKATNKSSQKDGIKSPGFKCV
jgi:hypothetical protein